MCANRKWSHRVQYCVTKNFFTFWNVSDIEAALDHMNDATIIEMENFTIRKVTDYSSADFQDKIKKTNKPSAILD